MSVIDPAVPAYGAFLTLGSPVSEDRYRCRQHVGGATGMMFGGYVAAQAVLAAGASVASEFGLHSLHGYFLLGGDLSRPLDLDVERVRDGRTYANRMVRATQGGDEIFRLMASYQRPEAGLEDRAVPAPDVPWFDELESSVPAPSHGTWVSPLDVAEIRHALVARHGAPHRAAHWCRLRGPIDDDSRAHEAALAFLSDLGMAAVASLSWEDMPIMRRSRPVIAKSSIDHAVWIHRQAFRADEWLLIDMESSTAGGARGHTTARVFTADGSLIATLAQESVQRPIRTSGQAP